MYSGIYNSVVKRILLNSNVFDPNKIWGKVRAMSRIRIRIIIDADPKLCSTRSTFVSMLKYTKLTL